MPLLTAKDSFHGSRKPLAQIVKNSLLAAMLTSSLASPACATATYPDVTDLTTFPAATFHLDGVSPDLPYRHRAPNNNDPNKLYPLVVALHGNGAIANGNGLQLTNETTADYSMMIFIASSATLPDNTTVNNQEKYPCFFLAPQLQQGGDFTNPSTITQLTALVRSYIATHNVDPNRVYITGLSGGAYGVYAQLQAAPDLYAAAAPASGASFDPSAPTWLNVASHKVNIWAFHNANDATVTPTSELQLLTNYLKVGGHALYTFMASGGHASWRTAYNSNTPLVPWMFAQKRGVVSRTADPISTTIIPPTNTSGSMISLTGTSVINDNTYLPGPISGVAAQSDQFVGANKSWPGFMSALAASVTVDASGNWSASPLASARHYVAMAEGSIFPNVINSANGGSGGNTFYPSPVLTVNPNYHVAVTSPTSTGSFMTTSSTVTLSGTDAPDKSTATPTMMWTNATTGASGTITPLGAGSSTWTANNIPLAVGTNNIVITAFNQGASNFATVDYVVTRNVPVLIGFGPDTVTDPTGAKWNVTGNAPPAGGYSTALLATDGSSSGITMTEATGVSASGTPGSGTTFGYNNSGYNGPSGSIVFPTEALPMSATIGSWYLGNGHQSTLTFSGLDTTGSASYTFTFISARNGGSTGRTATFTFEGATNVALNIDSGDGVSTGNPNVFSANLKAKSDGTIVLNVDTMNTPASPGFGGYINAMEITSP